MIPLRLTLTNFIGVRDGLGRDEITIDLESMTDDQQLVAITGPNGCGKTTIIDNLTPYRLLAYRAAGYSPGSFSYYDHTYGDARKVLEWEHDGERYRSDLVIKGSNKTKKTEAYLQRLAGDAWVPMELPDRTVSDGKTANYDRCVNHVLGTPEMYYTAVFSAQERRRLSSYGNSEIKEILAELLGLQEIGELHERAAEVLKILRAKARELEPASTRATEEKEKIAAAEAEIDRLSVNVQIDGRSLMESRERMKDLARQLAEAQAAANEAAQLEIERGRLTRQIQEYRAAGARRLQEANEDIDQAMREKAARERALSEAQNDVSRYTQIAGMGDEIQRAKDADAEAQREIAEVQREIERMEPLERTRAELMAEVGETRPVIERLKTQGAALRSRLESVQASAQLADQVPCAGTDLQPRCPLLRDTLAQKARVAEMEAEIAEKIAEYRAAVQKAKDATDRAAEIAPEVETLPQLRESIRKLHHDRDAVAKTIALEAEYEVARSKLEHLDEQIVALKESIRQEIQHADKIWARIAAITEEAERNVADAQSALDRLPPADEQSRAEEAERAYEDAERSIQDIQRRVDQARERIAALKSEIRIHETRRADLAESVRRHDRLCEVLPAWELLTKALGRDGIVALAIDAAGPALAALTNDLLLECYGPRFTVGIVTQRETASTGALKEVFDIRVFDAETDEEKSLSVMSGGQKVYINECLTRAVALYQSEQSGRRYGCLFTDETDGALDAERKDMFMAMKRAVIRIGGYRREFFISQSPELCAAADCQINMETYRQ